MKSRSYNHIQNPTGATTRKKQGKNGTGRVLLDYVMIPATYICVPLLLLSYLAPYINPNKVPYLALLGLAAPILYMANIALTLYWTVRWRKITFVPLVAIVLGLGGVSLFYRPMISKYYPEATGKNSFRVMSYNVCGFIGKDSLQRYYSTTKDITDFVNLFKPDILCIQEFQTTPTSTQQAINSMLADYRYSTVNFSIQSHESGFGQAIYSRFPITKSGYTHFENSLNSSIWADIVINRDTIRFINSHLQTTSIKHADYKFETDAGIVEDAEEATWKVKNIARKLTANYKIRAGQADTISLQISRSPYPIIVCGDFNDTPVSYTYRTIRGGLKDSYCEKGHGMINTYRGFFNLFRIDYILYSKELKALDYASPSFDKSDHNPVITAFKFVNP